MGKGWLGWVKASLANPGSLNKENIRMDRIVSQINLTKIDVFLLTSV